jgi:hypothetical protein
VVPYATLSPVVRGSIRAAGLAVFVLAFGTLALAVMVPRIGGHL